MYNYVTRCISVSSVKVGNFIMSQFQWQMFRTANVAICKNYVV